MTSICVIGLGYIGLPTSALLASRGFRVFGVDVKPAVVETVSGGGIHIVEPGLGDLVRKTVLSGALTAHLRPRPADVFIITTPTPLNADRRPDLGYVFSAAGSIAPYLRRGSLVIVESTCPVGSTDKVRKLLKMTRPDLSIATNSGTKSDVSVAYCPERVLPGRILEELVENDRCVGGLTPDCTERAARLYESFVRGKVQRTDAPTAELVKLTENAFRDVNVAFANEISMVADQHEIDVHEVIKLANRHPRVNILSPGPGVGGHCIAVDPWFIVDGAPAQARLIRTAREVNDRKADYVFELVSDAIASRPDLDVTCFGIAFKPNVDDLRESPALQIAERIGRVAPGRMAIVDPLVTELPKALRDMKVPLLSLDRGLARQGIFVLLVNHTAFCHVPRESLVGRMIFDTRGIWGQLIPDDGKIQAAELSSAELQERAKASLEQSMNRFPDIDQGVPPEVRFQPTAQPVS